MADREIDAAQIGIDDHYIRRLIERQIGAASFASIANKEVVVGIGAGDHLVITRWYVDASFGYIWPRIHIGPVAGGYDHGSYTPDPYCTWYDSRTCPGSSTLELWVQ